MEEQKEDSSNKLNPDDYVTLTQIGWGNFSDLFLVEHKITKELFCLKVFEKNKVERLRKEGDVLMEKHVMGKVPIHNHIIKFYGSKKDDFMLYLLYEYVNGGELWKKCIYYGIPGELLIKYYFKQILIAVQHLHSYSILHRDIKPENIMLTKDNITAKLIDFGSCKDEEGTDFDAQIKERQKKEKRQRPVFEHYVGTPNYMAPECVHNKESTKKSDMFSLGCLLYQLYFGFPPFMGKSEYLIYLKSTKCDYKIPNNLVSKEVEDLIRSLITLDPSERPNIEAILDSNYMQFNIEDFKLDYEADSLLLNILQLICKNEDLIENGKVSSKLRHQIDILSKDHLYCNTNELLFKLVINKILEHLKEARISSNSLDTLLKEQQQFSQNDDTDKTEEEKSKDITRNEKIRLLTIKVTNNETEFDYLWSNILKTLNSSEEESKNYWINKFDLTKKQIQHDLFHIDIEF